MTYEDFIQSLNDVAIQRILPPALLGLWYDGRGDWQRAHDAVQNENDRSSALVHAYLHRKEGDTWNARYWYSKAGKKPFDGGIEEEWEQLVTFFLIDPAFSELHEQVGKTAYS